MITKEKIEQIIRNNTNSMPLGYKDGEFIPGPITISLDRIVNEIFALIPAKHKAKKEFVPPTEEEVIAFFKENGFSESAAKKFYIFYSADDWRDSNEKKVKNWKAKARRVWFTDENKDYKKESSKDDFSFL